MDEKTDSREQEVAIEDWQTPGIMLRTARRASGLPEEDLVEQLGLTTGALRALEADDYERLPAAVYIKGYIRRYCDIVDISPRPILECFESHYREVCGEPKPPPKTKPAMVSQPVIKPRRKSGFGIASMALVLLLICVAVAAFVFADRKGAWVLGLDTDTAGEQGNGPAGQEAAVAPRTKSRVSLMPVSSAMADAGEGPESVAGEEVRDPGRLHLAFSADSWLEIVDAEGRLLAVDLQRAGSELDVSGTPPFDITIGYGPAASLTYMGEPVTIEPNPQTSVAKLTLGQ